ncbi:major facilitator superfamily permease [Saprospira grandis DSM 2844]|uniref:Major facilitator superfamily permease n=1 Tax=Saprospira grandis DSM 2844 TaxID=694433 RepID=J1I451_9BACT|nr:MFS transporter [Saprospira grandis]EJF53525.1 major facilitator superfamily permease [Saprospira grandis DSM 2844]
MRNKSAIRLLLGANFISGVAQGISMIAVPLYFAESGQSAWFGLAYTLITLVTLFWAPYAGSLVDKHDRKKLFLVLMAFMALALAALSALGFSQGLNNYIAVGAFALTFWNYSLHYLCFYAFMQEITEREHYGKIASLLEVQGQLASALAGGAAVVLLDPQMAAYWGFEAWELPQIFALDASTYVLGLLIIFFMKFESLTKREAEQGSLWKRLKIGWDYLKGEPYVFLFGVLTHAVFITVLLHVFELSPTYVKQCLAGEGDSTASIFAISEVLYSVGAVLAGLAIQRIFKGFSFLSAIILLTLITLLEYGAMFLFYSVGVFWAVSLLLGLSNAGVRVIRVSYLFEVVPNQVIGRANSIFGISNTLFRLGFLALFSLPFFHEKGQVVFSFLIFMGFLGLSAGILGAYYGPIVGKREAAEEEE